MMILILKKKESEENLNSSDKSDNIKENEKEEKNDNVKINFKFSNKTNIEDVNLDRDD